jgi:hypothetical protein
MEVLCYGLGGRCRINGTNGFRHNNWLKEAEASKVLPRKVEFEEVENHRQRSMKQTSLSDFIP